jgi:CheY-like chemotaxis protein
LGIATYLIKPVTGSELFDALLKALGPKAAGEEAIAPAPAARSRREQRNWNVLLAEDNMVNQRLAVRMLEKWGCSVTVAADGTEALEAVSRQPFDFVLMDVQMPKMGGFEATRLIRERENHTGAHLPIIALTAHAMTGDRERCLEAGMDDYISKPIHPQELLEKVDNLLGQTVDRGTRPGID